MYGDHTLLHILLGLFTGILIMVLILAPGPDTFSSKVIEVDMLDSLPPSLRDIPRPRPRPETIKPHEIEPLSRPVIPREISIPDQNQIQGPVVDASNIHADSTALAMDIPAMASMDAASAAAGFMTRDEYLELFKIRVAAIKEYPDEARSQDIQGHVLVRFILDAQGAIQKVEVNKSSGFPILDQAAMEAVRRAAPFPRTPPDLFDYPITMQLEVCFELT